MAHRFKLTEFRQRRIDEASIVVELDDDGNEIVIPPAECWPDKLPSALANGGEDLIRAIIGDEQFDRYIAAGGTMKILNAIVTEAQGATPGES